jgi:hypothetical protein
MTAWFYDIAIIATSNGIYASSSAFVGAEEVFIDSSKTIEVLVAQPG